MIYTLKRSAYLYRWEGWELPKGGPDHEGQKGDRFQLVGFVGDTVILHKSRGLGHSKLYAVPQGWLKNDDVWWVIE